MLNFIFRICVCVYIVEFFCIVHALKKSGKDESLAIKFSCCYLSAVLDFSLA